MSLAGRPSSQRSKEKYRGGISQGLSLKMDSQGCNCQTSIWRKKKKIPLFYLE